ncbi:unnamed protein product [Protopolystoma xenopodis]|uniref:Uncharacterized protein n=1 Tax=Protopolystoma xenopodis TaxID=117903 RepID=A0A448XNZ3_9PLAT|nr:unnamed protein product [Protopolystoma xenopodis]
MPFEPGDKDPEAEAFLSSCYDFERADTNSTACDKDMKERSDVASDHSGSIERENLFKQQTFSSGQKNLPPAVKELEDVDELPELEREDDELKMNKTGLGFQASSKKGKRKSRCSNRTKKCPRKCVSNGSKIRSQSVTSEDSVTIDELAICAQPKSTLKQGSSGAKSKSTRSKGFREKSLASRSPHRSKVDTSDESSLSSLEAIEELVEHNFTCWRQDDQNRCQGAEAKLREVEEVYVAFFEFDCFEFICYFLKINVHFGFIGVATLNSTQ